MREQSPVSRRVDFLGWTLAAFVYIFRTFIEPIYTWQSSAVVKSVHRLEHEMQRLSIEVSSISTSIRERHAIAMAYRNGEAASEASFLRGSADDQTSPFSFQFFDFFHSTEGCNEVSVARYGRAQRHTRLYS